MLTFQVNPGARAHLSVVWQVCEWIAAVLGLKLFILILVLRIGLGMRVAINVPRFPRQD
jgi:hypothetical protein